MSRTVFKRHAIDQRVEFSPTRIAVHTNRILANNLSRWVHQCIRQRPVCREQQQTGRREIQAPDRNPAGPFEFRQRIED